MGRYKRKKHIYTGSGGKGSHSKNGNDGDFSVRQKAKIREYLQEYRDRAVRAQTESSQSEEQVASSKEKEACIAGITLPKLANEIFEQPYLSLPADLSFRQRQFVHDCCIDRKLLIEGRPGEFHIKNPLT